MTERHHADDSDVGSEGFVPQPRAMPGGDQPRLYGDLVDHTDHGIRYGSYFDSPELRKLSPGKRHHSERLKGFHRVERWSNAKCAYIGFLAGRGHTSGEIEKILGDGTSRDTVRGCVRRWGLPRAEFDGKPVLITPVAFRSNLREKLARRAKAAGIEPYEYIRRVITCTVDDDLYAAVVDDRFEEPAPVKGPAKAAS